MNVTAPRLSESLLVEGSNFSGRSHMLRGQTIDLPSLEERRRNVLLPTSVLPALSGIALLVDQELALHGPSLLTSESAFRIDQILGVERFADRFIQTLSGGETARLVIGAALRQRPDLIAVDCVFEQVDAATRVDLYGAIASSSGGPRFLIADNRSDEIAVPLRRAPSQGGGDGLALPLDAEALAHVSLGRACIELRCDGLTFGYSRRQAPVLADINCNLRPGIVHYLEGVNGAGKSTLSRLLCGAHVPWSGKVFARGSEYRPSKKGNCLIAYHFQDPDVGRVEADLTSECKLMRASLSRKALTAAHSSRDSEEVAAWINAFGLNRLATTPIQRLPYVLRKRCDLCACFASGASWLILDEPTLGQDARTVEQIAKMTRALTLGGAGVIVISHSQRLRHLLPGIRLQIERGHLSIVASELSLTVGLSDGHRPNTTLE